MARVLLVVIPEKGHLNGFIEPALAMQRAGHAVAVYAHRNIADVLGRAGLKTFFSGSTEPPSAANRGRTFAEQVKKPGWLQTELRAFLLGNVDRYLDSTRQAIRNFQPTVVMGDSMAYHGPIAAALESVPWGSISSTLSPVTPRNLRSELASIVESLETERNALFQRHGVAPAFAFCDYLAPTFNAVFTTEEFVGPPPATVRLVGPSVANGSRGEESLIDPRWELANGHQSLLYVALGSQIYYQPELLRKLLLVAPQVSEHVVISAGELSSEVPAEDIPANVTLVSYAPQRELLKRAAVMVTHGGAASLMEAIAFGVPILVSPIMTDQPNNAYLVERSGIGVTLDIEACEPDTLLRALLALIAAPNYRARAQALRLSYTRANGPLAITRLATELGG